MFENIEKVLAIMLLVIGGYAQTKTVLLQGYFSKIFQNY